MRPLVLMMIGCSSSGPTPCIDGFQRGPSGNCEAEATPEPTDSGMVQEDPDTILTPLDDPRLLRRLSLDLLGRLPSVEELNGVEADPDALDAFIEQALDDPQWEERLVHIYGQTWHTRVDEFQLLFAEYDNLYLDNSNEYPFERSAGEEPLRLLAHVAARDLPYSEVLTADYTIANEMLASVWPIEYSGEGWTQSRYTDDRPAAGVLATNGMWLRYYTVGSNHNRGRAAAISRLLICEDYLARPISFENTPSLADENGTQTALKTEPYCLSCHATLDPIAATLFGFEPVDAHNGDETGWYHPEREPLGPLTLDLEPAWFGAPVSGLSTLVQHIAADDRFEGCAVETMVQALWQRQAGRGDIDALLSFRETFRAGHTRIRPLVRAILDSEPYRAGGANTAAENTARLVGPEQWSSLVEDLSGFHWVHQGFDQMDNDTYGYRTMTGGVDGLLVTRPSRAPTVTGALVIQRLTEAGARAIVEESLGSGSGMLGQVSSDHTPSDGEWTATTEALFWHIIARRPTETDIDALAELFTLVAADTDPDEAWVAVISGVLRHPESVRY